MAAVPGAIGANGIEVWPRQLPAALAIRRNAFWSKQQVQANRVRNRALLIGTGWTLAAAAALALFKSFPSEPIYLWSLGVVASGWAAVSLHALASAERAARASVAAAGCEFRVVIDRLAQAMALQMQQAGSELARVDELLAHAIEQLVTAFSSVGEVARRRQSELAQTAAGAQGTAEAERLRAAAERVASDVNSAVTAMQFRDVVGQKLGHVRRELEALEKVMHLVREVSAAPPAAPFGRARVPEQADVAARVRGLLRELEQAKSASPARQELMHAGEVDLF